MQYGIEAMYWDVKGNFGPKICKKVSYSWVRESPNSIQKLVNLAPNPVSACISQLGPCLIPVAILSSIGHLRHIVLFFS